MNYLDLAFIKYKPTGITGGFKDMLGRISVPYSFTGFVMSDDRTNTKKTVSLNEIPQEFFDKPYSFTSSTSQSEFGKTTFYKFDFLSEPNPEKSKTFNIGVFNQNQNSEVLLLESKFKGDFYLKKWAEEKVNQSLTTFSIQLSPISTYENFVANDYNKLVNLLNELKAYFNTNMEAERVSITMENISNSFNPRAGLLLLPEHRKNVVLHQAATTLDSRINFLSPFTLLDYFAFRNYPDHKEAFLYEYRKRNPPSSNNSFGDILGALGALAMPAVFTHKLAVENPEITSQLFMPTAVTQYAIENPVESAAFVAVAMTAGAGLAALPSAEVATAAIGTALMDEGKGFLVDQGKKQIQQLIGGNQPTGSIQTDAPAQPVQTKQSNNIIITLAAAVVAGAAALLVV